MDWKERENFIRNSTLIVEHTKEGFTDLIDLNVSQAGYQSFEIFINAYQHEIYHLCYNRSRCCQCPRGYILPNVRVLHQSQLELLLDNNGPKKLCHNARRAADFCCSLAYRGLITSVLNVTLARCLLVNFCDDVFWYSCLTTPKRSFEEFLTQNKHMIYHLYEINRCCQCSLCYVFPVQTPVINQKEWIKMFSTLCLPCSQDINRVGGGRQSICSTSVTGGITLGQLDCDLLQTLIKYCCPLKQEIENLVKMRNTVFGHVTEARISDRKHLQYRTEIESSLLMIARICNNEKDVKHKLQNLDRRSLDGTLVVQSIKEQLHFTEAVKENIGDRIGETETQIEFGNRQKEVQICQEITSLHQKVIEMADTRREDTAELLQTMKSQLPIIQETVTQGNKEMFDSRLTLLERKLDKLFSKQIAADIIKIQIEEKRKKLVVQTEQAIETHCNEKTFVHIHAVDKAFKCVKNNGIVVLIGSPGIGKSRIGLELLRQITAHGENYQPLQLDDISQWQDMTDGTDVIFIDDVFGRTNCSYNDNTHSKSLDMIFASIQNDKVKVILTLRNGIYREIADLTASLGVFNCRHVLDFSSHNCQMNLNEKKSCLLTYLGLNRIKLTDNPKEENYNNDYILDPSVTVQIHKDTITKTLQADMGMQVGFPEACYLFSSHRKFTMQGPNFFYHPTELLSNEIDNLRTDGDKNIKSMIDFTLLVYALLNDNDFNIYDIEPDAFRTIMKTIYLNPLSHIPKSYINDAAKRLTGKYLKISCNGDYCFQHRLISEAILLSYSSTDPRSVIPLLELDFIVEMARPQFYQKREGEVSFPVPVQCYGLLAKRLLHLLETDFNKKPWHFIQSLCKSVIITITGKDILRELASQYKFVKRFGFEFIRDHRFSRGTVFEAMSTDFYLPAALMMFSDIDNDLVYQCLFGDIHNRLISESDGDVKNGCKVTLLTILNFAICTLDAKRSTVILKILRDTIDYNITYHHLPYEFRNNVVICQGVPGVQFMLNLPNLDHVCSITFLLWEIFGRFTTLDVNFDSNMKQLITSVIVNYDHYLLPVNEILSIVCRRGELDFVKDICAKFDSSLFDVVNMILEACSGWNFEVMQWLIDRFLGLYDKQMVFDEICKRGQLKGIQIVHTLIKFDIGLIGIKSAMNKACISGNIELVKWFCDTFDNNLFDMNKLMYNACNSSTELVKWLCEKFDNNLLDMKSVMNCACGNDDIELVKWLCENVDNNLFNMTSVVNYACISGNTKLLKWLQR